MRQKVTDFTCIRIILSQRYSFSYKSVSRGMLLYNYFTFTRPMRLRAWAIAGAKNRTFVLSLPTIAVLVLYVYLQ